MVVKMWFLRRQTSSFLVTFLWLIGVSNCLRDVRISIPAAVRRGAEAALRCQYDIESDILYSVKWYRGDREFYRYVPKEKPVMKVFPIPGLNVVTKRSNASVVTLAAVDDGAAGKYNCEVSADSPSFHTYMVTGIMDVVDVPSHKPVITGVKPRYRVGDVLRGNCTCKHSRPAANLTWSVNSHQTDPMYLKRYKHITNAEGLQTAVLQIQFKVGAHHFVTGKLKIRCTASLYSVYHHSTEKSIEEERIKNTYGMGEGVISNNIDGNGLNGGGVPPESQHVAIMYPVHGTAYDQDLPPIPRDTAYPYSGGQCSISRNSRGFTISFLVVCEILRQFLFSSLGCER